MRNLLLSAACLAAMAAFTTGPARAEEDLMKMSQNPKDWVMPTGDYANQRYSKLKQITAKNVGKLQVAWTFSTGVLRGHEGAPLVIGDTMYVHTAFPNNVYALDLNNDGADDFAVHSELPDDSDTFRGILWGGPGGISFSRRPRISQHRSQPALLR